MKALAVIPTIGASRYLKPLVRQLREEQVCVLLITNTTDPVTSLRLRRAIKTDMFLYRPAWRGIYRQWNLGIRYGALLGVPVLVLNDDIVLESGAATKVINRLSAPDSVWAVIGFDYQGLAEGWCRSVNGTYRHNGVGGFAFGVNPRRCARVDRRFMWWGGDDDLVHATLRKGELVGVLGGARVTHPEPSLTANAHPELLPEGWEQNDRELVRTKWADEW